MEPPANPERFNRNFTRASLDKFIKAVDAALDDYLQRLDQGDATESGTVGSRVENLDGKIAALRKRRDRTKKLSRNCCTASGLNWKPVPDANAFTCLTNSDATSLLTSRGWPPTRSTTASPQVLPPG